MKQLAGRPEESGRPAWLSRLELRHRAWRYQRRVDPEGIRWLRATLGPGDVAVDVGAYKGGYTWWMRRAVGGAGLVLAFEPQPAATRMLRRYVSAFEWTNVTVVECALSSEPGSRALRVPDARPSPAASLVGASLQPGATEYAVDVDTLDRQLPRISADARVALLKVDVEGHELDVFRGARGTIAEHRPAIIFECEARHLRGTTMDDVFTHLMASRYRGSFLERGRLVDLAHFDAGRHQVEGRHPYVNNFVFLPA
ncbi:MAG: FkbM family methyltransferase [Longimicrobiales bacterium]